MTVVASSKPRPVDYLATIYHLGIFAFAIVFVYFYQQIWIVARNLLSSSRLEVTKDLAGKAYKRVNKNLPENTGDQSGLDAEKVKTIKEIALKAINGSRGVHAVSKHAIFRFNPFWQRYIEYETPVETLNKGTYVYMGNHLSYADFVYTSGLGMLMTAVGKSSLLDIPLGGRVLRNAGFLPVHFEKKPNGKWGTSRPKTEQMLKRAVELLQGGCSIFVFPEGQITTKKEPMSFKPGFFDVARNAGVEIVPVALHNTDLVWPMAKKHVPRSTMSTGTAYVKIGTPMKVLDPSDVSLFSDRQDLVASLEETYNVDLSTESKRDSESALVDEYLDQIIEFNVTEKISNKDYATIVSKLYIQLVRARIYQMKLELEKTSNMIRVL